MKTWKKAEKHGKMKKCAKKCPSDGTWVPPGHILVALGWLLGALGALLDALGALLDALGALLGCSWALLGASWTPALDIPPLSSLSKEVWRPHNMMTCPGFLALAVRLLWTVVLALAAPQKG